MPENSCFEPIESIRERAGSLRERRRVCGEPVEPAAADAVPASKRAASAYGDPERVRLTSSASTR